MCPTFLLLLVQMEYGLLCGLWVWRRRTNRRPYCHSMSNPSTSSWIAWPDGSRRWDNRMAAQHLPWGLVRPSSGLKNWLKRRRRRRIFLKVDFSNKNKSCPMVKSVPLCLYSTCCSVFFPCFLMIFFKLESVNFDKKQTIPWSLNHVFHHHFLTRTCETRLVKKSVNVHLACVKANCATSSGGYVTAPPLLPYNVLFMLKIGFNMLVCRYSEFCEAERFQFGLQKIMAPKKFLEFFG